MFVFPVLKRKNSGKGKWIRNDGLDHLYDGMTGKHGETRASFVFCFSGRVFSKYLSTVGHRGAGEYFQFHKGKPNKQAGKSLFLL